jgi:hypothetical protein
MIIKYLCPICERELMYSEKSSGGDGLLVCSCGWVEDPTKTDIEQGLIEGVEDGSNNSHS